jgi:sporulation protein YqfC
LKKKKGKIREKLSTVFELPLEATSGATRMILVNNTDLFLENHKGIREYTLDRVRIHTERHEIVICGKDMELRNMGAENIVITGEITSIEYEA